MKRLIHGDCLEFLRSTDEKFDCIFADPPDNLKLDYDGYTDYRDDYYDWLDLIFREALLKTPVLWVSYFHAHDLEIKYRLRNILRKYHPAHKCRQFVWVFNFGQYRETDAPSDHRPIVRVSSPLWKPTMTERIESVREKMGDLRATGKGRVPGDVWEYDWQPMLFTESRIQGNNSERRPHHPTQHPEAIYHRIATMAGGSSFLDLFAGTGTAFRASLPQKNITAIEQSENYCNAIAKEHGIHVEENY